MGASKYMNNKQGDLEINQYYWFLLIKTTVMPDGVEYYVLEDIYKNRHLMEKKPYESYGFKLKDKVEIRIDKVNCKGKVFFEPKQPRYSIGSTIQAKFIEHSTEKDKFEEERHILIVEDPDGNRSTIRTTNDDQRDINYKPDYINCVVDGISKGCLILRSIGD